MTMDTKFISDMGQVILAPRRVKGPSILIDNVRHFSASTNTISCYDGARWPLTFFEKLRPAVTWFKCETIKQTLSL